METCANAVRLVRGPQGVPGEDGVDGGDGVSAFTLLTAVFTMPAELATAVASVVDTTWMTPGQIVYMQGAGWLEVTLITDAVTVVLKNLEDAATGVYAGNVAAGTVIALSNKIVASGPQGPGGSAASAGAPTAASYLTRQAEAGLSAEFNLGGLTTGLLMHTVAAGVSTPSTAADGGDYLSPLTGLIPGDIGGTVQGWNALLDNVAGLVTAADQVIYTTGVNTVALSALTAFARTLLDDASAAAARSTLGVMTGYGLLGSVTAWDLNSATTDTAFTIGSGRYVIDKVTVDNASVNLTTATGGVFTAAGGGGTTVAADQALSALTASTKFDDLTLNAVVGTDVMTAGTLYARCGTAQGGAATATLRVWGWKLD